MHRKRTDTGSITVEAAISLPIFLCVIFSIVFFIKVVRTQEIIQHAIYQSALELSTVSYIFHASGLEAVHDSVQEGIRDNSQVFTEHAGVIFDSLKDLNQFAVNISESPEKGLPSAGIGDAADIVDNFIEITGMAKEIANDPQMELKAIACYIAGGYFEDLKTEVCVPLVKLYMGKYLLAGSKVSLNARLKQLGIKNGVKGLDFSRSRFLEDDNENLEIVVYYQINLPIPFKFFSDPIMVQRCVVKAWLGGDDPVEIDEEKQDNIWSLTNFQRGRKIRKIYGANLPESFPVISKFKDGTATMIKSMDITAQSYKDAAYTQEKLHDYIDKLASFKGQEEPWGSKDIVIRGSEIKSRELLLVIPGNTLEPGAVKALEACRQYAEAKGIIFKVEKYGMKAGEEK